MVCVLQVVIGLFRVVSGVLVMVGGFGCLSLFELVLVVSVFLIVLDCVGLFWL